MEQLVPDPCVQQCLPAVQNHNPLQILLLLMSGMWRAEPLQGTSDCHRYTLTLNNGVVAWFTTPYSAANSASYSYAPYKRYTTSLGDGKKWNFSLGNINDYAVGTKDTDSDAVVITTGYSTRSITTTYYISSIS